MFDTQIWAKDVQGTMQAVRVNSEGALLSALDVSDITLETALTDPLPAGTNNIGNVGALITDPLPVGTNNIGDVDALATARTANPVAVADGDAVKLSTDDLGRGITRPVQARDLIATAYTTLINGTETTLKTGVVGAYLDLIYLTGANLSDVAVPVDIRDVTAGNIVTTLIIPPMNTIELHCPVPFPQSATGNDWTADIDDITGTTVYLSALFSQEI